MLKKTSLSIGLSLSLFLFSNNPLKAQDFPFVAQNREESSQISPSKKELIEQLVEVTQMRQLWEQVLQVNFSQFEQNFPELLATVYSDGDLSEIDQQELELQQEQISEIMKKFQDKIQQAITFDEVLNKIYYPVYDKYFTEQELKDILAFYETSTGKKTIEIMPQLTTEVFQSTNELMMPKMIAIIKELIEEEMPQLK